MNYFKSVLAGLAAVLIVCGVLPGLAALIYFYGFVKNSGGGETEIVFHSYALHWRVPSLAGWLFVLAVFVVGFLWQFRRLAKRAVLPSADSSRRPGS